MAVDADSRRTVRRYKHRQIRGEVLAWTEISDVERGLRDARLARQVALFADGVSFGEGELPGVHDVPCLWMGQMIGSVAMAAVAGDSVESRNIGQAVECFGNNINAARVAEQALGGDGAIEVRLAIV